jgi:hypothetical protein
LTKQWFLLQDIAQLHIENVMMEVLVDFGGIPVEHPPCSQDLALCAFFLAFSVLKHGLQGQKFGTDTEVKQATAGALQKMSGNGLQHIEEWGI